MTDKIATVWKSSRLWRDSNPFSNPLYLRKSAFYSSMFFDSTLRHYLFPITYY